MSLIGFREWRGSRDAEVAIRFEDDEVITFAELDGLLNRVVNSLLVRDLGPGRRVAVFAENHPNTLVAYAGALLAGCSPVPINFHLLAEECAYILRDADARLLFVGPENVEVGLEAARLANQIPVVAWDTQAARQGLELWGDMLASADEEPPDDIPPRPFLYYTSGTTGFPKGTESVPNALMGDGAATIGEQVETIVKNRPADMRARLTMAPLYHYAQVSVVKRAVLAGVPMVLYKKFDPERTLRAIDRYMITDALIVPAQFVRMLALPEEVRATYDLSSLKRVTTGAAPCPWEVKRRVLEWFGPSLWEGYGATEVGSITTILAEEMWAHPGSVGKVHQQLRLYVIDEEGNELGTDQVGRLYFEDVTGAVDLRYYNDEEKTDAAHLRPGVWTLGDVGYLDDDGYLYLTDRFADMINSSGLKIYPAEAEQVIGDLPGVADVGCIGVPHPELGEVLHALVVPLDPNNLPDPRALIAQTQERLSKFKCPRSVEFVFDLGRTPTGKLNKRNLRQRYERGELATLPLSKETSAA
jgi:long-chain acyl-CoA synthetase